VVLAGAGDLAFGRYTAPALPGRRAER